MAGYILGLYPEFACLADRCPATCCSGWKIIIDIQAFQRFHQIPDEKLRQDILGSIVEQEDVLRFVNRSNGDCAMLDTDGLCRIQRNTEESMLCHTCRKYPRLSANLPQPDGEMGIWLSLAASCPVVAEYILDGQVTWFRMDAAGNMRELSAEQAIELADFTGLSENSRWMQSLDGSDASCVRLDPARCFDVFVDIAMEALDVMIQFAGIPYLEGSFDLYDAEEPDMEKFHSFFEETQAQWQPFVRQYTYYRFPSRYLEFPAEELRDRVRQVQGELLLMRVMLCSRYCLSGGLNRADWLDIIHWVYRFCVHGECMAKKVHDMFVSWSIDWLQMVYQNVRLQL